jgi:hypothetical protein
VYISIHAQPGARREKICGMHGDALKIAVRQAPQDGKANQAIMKFLADALCLSRQDVDLSSGLTSRRKRFFVKGDAKQIIQRLEELLRNV